MSQPTGTTSHRVSTSELLAVAKEVDPTTTKRRLEFWRNQGLLPHAERSGQDGNRPVWTHPAEAKNQLRTLLRLREKTKDPDVLRVALWFDGYHIATSQARASITAYLRQSKTAIDLELQQRLHPDTEAKDGRRPAIDDVAKILGRRRSTGIPRTTRQRQHERINAIAVAMSLALGEPHAGDALNEGSATEVEKMLGLTPGRSFRLGDAGPWLAGPALNGLEAFARIGNLTALIEAAESADNAELETARSNASMLILGVSFAARLADALTGRPNVTGLTAMVELARQPDICIWTTALFASLGRFPDHAKSIQELVEAIANLQTLEDQVKAIAAISPDERVALLKNLPNLPFREQAAIRRVVNEFSPKPTT